MDEQNYALDLEEMLYTLGEALEKNRIMLEKEGTQAWNQREYKTLLLIKDYLVKLGNEKSKHLYSSGGFKET